MDAAANRVSQILAFIRSYRAAHGYSPSLREIRDGCGMSSTSVTRYWLDVMAKRGLVTWSWGKARTVQVVGHAGNVLD